MRVISKELAQAMNLPADFTYSYEKQAGRHLQVLVHMSGGYSVAELESALEDLRQAEKLVLENAVLLIPNN